MNRQTDTATPLHVWHAPYLLVGQGRLDQLHRNARIIDDCDEVVIDGLVRAKNHFLASDGLLQIADLERDMRQGLDRC